MINNGFGDNHKGFSGEGIQGVGRNNAGDDKPEIWQSGEGGQDAGKKEARGGNCFDFDFEVFSGEKKKQTDFAKEGDDEI